jgi:Tfp pilus assembly PilM family ATPase
MKISLFRSVVPPHVFCLQAEGVTWAQVRMDPSPGFAHVRYTPYPPNSVGAGASGTPLFSRESIAEAVETARRQAGGRLSRATVLFPDAWARMMPIDFDTLPQGADAAREMVLWKLKKLLPGVTADLSVVFRDMPPVAGERRLLVAAAPAETLHSVEQAFDAAGVRVGALAPASLALFEGLAPRLAARSAGDYALVHRSPGSFVLFVARESAPLFFRQRPVEAEDGDHEQEVRLSLSYYAEKLKGAGLAAAYVHDELAAAEPFDALAAFPRPPLPLTGALFGADGDFDARVASRPELLPAFAAVSGGA